MNILYVVQNYYPIETGGAGRSVQMLAESMARAGHKVGVVRLSDQKKKEIYTHNGVEVYALPIRNIYYYYSHAKKNRPAWQRMVWHAIDMFNPFALWDFNKVLKDFKPDIVNTNTISGFSTSLFYLVKFRGIKLVHTMRDYYLMCPQSGMYRHGHNCEKICAACKPFAAVRRKACRNVDMFLGNSRFVVERHRQHDMLPDSAIQHYQYNMNSDNNLGAVRRIDTSKPVRFGYIGNINPTKGTDVLIHATNMLVKDNWTLTVAGTGTEQFMDDLKKISSDKVSFVGWVSPNDFYPNIDILVCPSTYEEPLPRVIYEAYKIGLPVIASDRGGNPEIVDHGVTGYSYPAKDEKTLAAILESCLDMSSESYEMMSAKALEKARKFTPDTILAEYTEKLNQLSKTA